VTRREWDKHRKMTIVLALASVAGIIFGAAGGVGFIIFLFLIVAALLLFDRWFTLRPITLRGDEEA
jgi:fatty acid desaturase